MSSPCRRWASLVADETRILAAGDQEAHRSSASPACFNPRRWTSAASASAAALGCRPDWPSGRRRAHVLAARPPPPPRLALNAQGCRGADRGAGRPRRPLHDGEDVHPCSRLRRRARLRKDPPMRYLRGPFTARMVPRQPPGCAGQVCQTCPECPPRARTGACTDSPPVQKWASWSAATSELRASVAHRRCRSPEMASALDNGQRSPRKLLRAVIARLLGRSPEA
jgi:hypothetical protein